MKLKDKVINLKPCPFCGTTPKTSPFEWSNGNASYGIDIRCLCCDITMRAAISFEATKGLNDEQIIDAIQRDADNSWNARYDI